MTTLLAPPEQRPAQTSAGRDRRWWVLAVLGVAQLMVVLDSTVVNIALPHAQAALAFSDSARQWVVTAYSLSFGSLLLLGGRLADIFGRKRLFLIGVIGFAAASALGGAATNFAMLVSARAVQGAFGALLAPAALSILMTTFTSPQERGKAFGIYAGIAGSGASVGLLLGGFLTEYFDWRWTMYVNVFFAVVAAVGGAVLLSPYVNQVRARIDKLGSLLACSSMFAVVYGFAHAASRSGVSGWTDVQTLGFLAAGFAMLVAFVLLERRAANPLLPLRILADRNRGGANLAMFLTSIGMFGVFLFVTYYLETTLGYGPVQTGLAFLPLTIAIIVVAAIANIAVIPRVSSRLLIASGLLVAAVGMALLTRIGLHSGYGTDILPPLMLVAVGLGLVFSPAMSLGTLGVAGSDSGVASATVNVSQQIGGSIGTALLNTIATSAAASFVVAHATGAAPSRLLLAQAAMHSYDVAFWVCAGIFAAAAVAVGLLLRPGVPDLAANEGVEGPVVHA